MSRRSHSNNNRGHGNLMPKGTLVTTIKLDDIEPNSDSKIQIEGYEFIASYNWTSAMEPTIFVPGAPALWMPPRLPVLIHKDDGKARIDQNSRRVLAPSFAPLFAALTAMQPSYSLRPISLVTDRNSLRKLFDFVCGHPGESWRIDVEMVIDTLFLTRWEKNKVKIITGSFNSGYGHEFENTFVKYGKDLEDSCAHHRIVEYTIGGMKWMVRFEADGYFDNDPQDASMTSQPQSLSDLSFPMKALSLGSDPGRTTWEGVTVLQKGYLVPSASIVELKCKTRASKKDPKLRKKIPQCWFAQTEQVFLGHHNDGLVVDVETVGMTSAFKRWEKAHQNQLRKLMALVSEIREVARRVGDGGCCLVCDRTEQPRVLRVFKSDGIKMELSAEVKERFWEGCFESSAA